MNEDKVASIFGGELGTWKSTSRPMVHVSDNDMTHARGLRRHVAEVSLWLAMVWIVLVLL